MKAIYEFHIFIPNMRIYFFDKILYDVLTKQGGGFL